MLSHGLMTALFFALIGLIYTRTHTRDIREMGGLMKVIPFASVCYVIAGLASLGLPGLSGFVAEMTVFIGSFEHADIFRRVLTIVAAASIVITAVYILRTIAKILYGPVQGEHHLKLADATWYEKISVVGLIIFIAALGMFPSGVAELIQNSLDPIISKLM
jgi:NADH-quinone oxidoreductase subunit M